MTNPPLPLLSDPGRRLFWTLQGALDSAISVLGEDCNPDGPREPYLRAENNNLHHPIGDEPITTRPYVTLTVTEENIDGWRDEWDDINYEGFDEDIRPSAADLPPTFEPVVVTASNGEFVSVHDYVTVVHPWLMARREQILRARHVADDHYTPGVVEERMLVVVQNAEMIVAEDEQEWLATLRDTFAGTRRQREQEEAEQAAAASG
ncbi:hypothetical protein C8A05DRAFT_13332 [Staphylotrichum tortipilum]|uniref:Uncharacterized protein n=1 Tax=Staphylotrichum tortipilum TaxID=2831512 RepID=A0AAN6MQZ5_9PEZI|nr:hypothetical protein C8A05DRAFT_13332 [Staphylotrichum longicolle]